MSKNVEVIRLVQSGHTDADIALETGVSHARVRQIRQNWTTPHNSYALGFQSGMEAAAKICEGLAPDFIQAPSFAAAIREEIKKL